MRVFNKDNKINFVDEHNVLVGFDMGQSCCESFGWSLKRSDGTVIGDEGTAQLDGVNLAMALFSFDTGYCDLQDADSEAAHVQFRLIDPAGEHVYLILFNHHNGYYGHGFSMDIGGKSIWEGTL